MKCNNCQSEWNGVKELDTCPFCRANLKAEIKTKDFQSVGEFFNYALSVYGVEILRDGRKLVSLFADLAPELEQERNLLRIAAESGVYKDILATNNESESEKHSCVARCTLKLQSKYFMQSEWSEKVVFWLTDYLGWNVKMQTAPPPAPNSVQNVTSPKPVPQQSAVVTPKQTLAIEPSREVIRAREYQKRIAIGMPYNYEKERLTQHIVGILKDGTVIAVGDNSHGQCNVSDWRDVVAVAAGEKITIGIKKDGSVIYAGLKRCDDDFDLWTDITDIAISEHVYGRTVYGLKKDGTVVTSSPHLGQRAAWNDIVALSASSQHIVGLKKDGTVVSSGCYNENVPKLRNIVAISSRFSNVVALRQNGTVTETPLCLYKQENWTDIIAVSSNFYIRVGLKKDGTVIAIGNDKKTIRTVSKWKDIVAVWVAGYDFIIGLKKDGTLITTSKNVCGKKYNFDNWKLF